MALTRDTIVANAVLAGLTDEQVKAVEALSKNDEDTVIGKRIGEVYTEMDKKIESITGVKRDGDEKTYLYLERAAKDLKQSATEVETFKTQVADLTKEKLRLEKAVAEGATDAETKRQLQQAQADLTNVTNQYNTLKTEYDTAKTTHQTELFGIQVQNDLSLATASVKFKQDLPKTVTEVILNQALSKVKAMQPEYIDDGQGGKRLVFKDETGAVMRNPENQLNPFTASDLVQKELKALGVLEEGREQKGGGTGGSGGGGAGGAGGAGGVTVDISAAKTRVQANEIITQSLMQKGLTNGSEEFDKAMTEAWRENKVQELPEQ